MGKLNMFTISFANQAVCFYAGNMLEGYVTIELTEAMKMRGVRMNFEGKAYVHWTEQESRGTGKDRKTYTKHYSASEKYFDQDVLLHGIWPNQGSTTTELPPGRHTFPFRFQLPQGLPSSFEGHYGHVRYVVSCVIDKPWKFDHKTKRPFTIISILDLNQQPDCQARVQGHNEKHLCCWCCKSGPITATFHLDRRGYVPGEAIRCYAEISNGASRKMDKSYVELKQTLRYRATTKTKSVSKTMARLDRPSIEGHSEDVWSGEELVIPPLPPSFLVGCNIIDISYVLKLSVDPSGPALDLEVPLDVVIGTIPLMSVVQQYPPMPPVGFEGGAGVMPAPAFPAPQPGAAPAYPPNMPPPSYNECITGPVNIGGEEDEHTKGDLSYAPVYPYYNWGHTPGAMPPGEPEK